MFFDVRSNYLYGINDFTQCPQDLQMAFAMVHQAHKQGCGAILVTPPDAAFLNHPWKEITARFDELRQWVDFLMILKKMTRDEVNHHADLIKKLSRKLNERLNVASAGIEEDVLELMAYLKAHVGDPEADMKMFLGCEVAMDASNADEKISYLEAGSLPTLNGTRCVLVSFPDNIDRSDLWQCLHKLDQAGYIPVIAHAQTLGTFREHDGMHEIRCIKGDGLRDPMYHFRALIQLDTLSLQNMEHAKEMVREGVVDFLGTNAYNSFTNPPHIEAEVETASGICNPAYLAAISEGNAKKYFLKEGM